MQLNEGNADDFNGQVALVTGGAQGLGWALSQALADRGARVYACDISPDNIARAELELDGLPYAGAIHFACCDVADRVAVGAWVAGIYEREGHVDLLINNAAFIRWRDVLDLTLEDELLMMRVGFDGMLHCTRAVLPRMLAAGRGHIVNMGSSAGKIFAGSASAAYSAVKAAIDGYTQTLQVELRRAPVRLTLVRPAAIAGTDFFRRSVPSPRMPRLLDFMPYLTPPQVADAILRAVRRRRDVLDIPAYLPVLYLFFALAPRLSRWLMTRGSGGQRDYAQVDWRYTSHRK
jgi:NAD(P)-dependent dehydrogenase (short-subunit alcohol dehydrogenase family)